MQIQNHAQRNLGRVPVRRFSRTNFVDVSFCVALYGIAVALRLMLHDSPPYGDEGWHYFLAKHWLQTPPSLTDAYGQNWWHAEFVFWQRPLFYVLLHVPALFSFETARVAQVLGASLLPVAGYVFLRIQGMRGLTAALPGAILAIHPTLVSWGSMLLMDSWVAVLFLAGVMWLQRKRPVAGSLLLLAAAWTKETAIVGILALLGYKLLTRYRRGGVSLWPIRLDETESALAVALILSPVPLLASLSMGLPLPGGRATGSTLGVLEMVSLSAWFLPIIVGGLFLRRSRAVSLGALFWLVFFTTLHGLFGRAVEAWYAVLPATVAVLAAALSADSMLRSSNIAAKRLGILAVVLLVTIPGASAVVNEGPPKSRAIHPLDGSAAPSIEDLLKFRSTVEDADLARALEVVAMNTSVTVVAFDLHYGWLYYPLADERPRVIAAGSAFFGFWPQPLGPFVAAIEANSTIMFLQETNAPLNRAIRDTYLDCATWHEGRFWIYDATTCRGRLAALEALAPYPQADR